MEKLAACSFRCDSHCHHGCQADHLNPEVVWPCTLEPHTLKPYVFSTPAIVVVQQPKLHDPCCTSNEV